MAAILLGTRNTLYGLRMAPLLAWRGWRRVAAAHVLLDESTAMAVNRETTRGRPARASSTTGIAVFVLWNLATLGGALAGTALGDPRTYGLDAAVGAAFLALLWPRLSDRRNRLVAVGRRGGGARPGPAHARGRARCSPPAGWRCWPGSWTADEGPRLMWVAILVAGRGLLRAQAGRAVPAGAGAGRTRSSRGWPT